MINDLREINILKSEHKHVFKINHKHKGIYEEIMRYS